MFVEEIQKLGIERPIILDIGAGDGTEAMVMKQALPAATVYALDAWHLNAGRCGESGVIPIVAALWSCHGLRDFNVVDPPGLSGFRDRNLGNKCVVKMLPAMLDDLGLHLDAIKIDAEGCTADILDGGHETLKGCKLVQVEAETAAFFAGQTLQHKVFDSLQALGFVLVHKESCPISNGEQSESVWVRP